MVSGEVVCVVVVLVVAGAERKETIEKVTLGLPSNILIYKSHEHKYSLVVVVVSSVLVVVVVSSVLVVVVVLLLVGGTTVELVPVEVDDVAPVDVVVIVGIFVVSFGPEGWATIYIDIYTYETFEREQIDFYKVYRNTII